MGWDSHWYEFLFEVYLLSLNLGEIFFQFLARVCEKTRLGKFFFVEIHFFLVFVNEKQENETSSYNNNNSWTN